MRARPDGVVERGVGGGATGDGDQPAGRESTDLRTRFDGIQAHGVAPRVVVPGGGARWIGTGCARSRGRSDGARIPGPDRLPIHGSTRLASRSQEVDDFTV